MKNMFKRVLSLLMVLVLAGSMLPVSHAHGEETEDSIVLTDEDYAIVNDVFAQIDAMEDAPAKKSASRTQITDAAAEIVMASENYVEGSLERNGNSFTWWTDEGIRCIYNPYMREKYDSMEAPADPETAGIYNAPKATKGGWPSGNQVYLIAPYYGIDSSFTDQYKNEATSIASAIGDTDGYTLCSGSAVTVDTVADAIENGAVVIFDSHGTTDYDGSYVCTDPDGYEVYDYVSQANYSYLCLTSKTGLTTDDYNAGATYFTDSDGNMCACINGAAIANHMEGNSPAGILWMAICLGMATDTLCEPMREKGVEVVYGYSQSVTFAGDYCFEETFWDNMIAGKNVATSIAAMKSKWGNWDWSEAIASNYGYSGSGYSLSQARQYRSAFPIVVSDEDTHPGQRDAGTNYGACSEQTVQSTYTLFSQYAVTAQSNNTSYGTVSASGNTITAVPADGYFAESAEVLNGTATVSQNGNTFTVIAETDCTVQVNFAAKTAVTVSFSGADVANQSGYAGDSMTLPVAEAPEGFKFLGWTTSPLSGEVTQKPDYYTDSFIPTANTTLYALYSYVDESTGTGTGDYVKVTSTPEDWSGEYVIVYEADGYIFDGSLSSFDAVNNYKAVTISDNTIAAADADAYKFTIAAVDGGYSIQGTSGAYIGHGSNANGLTTGSSALVNTISMDSSGNANIIGSGGAYLRYNSTANQCRFRYYKSSSYSNQKAIALYLKDGSAGTTYYTSTPVVCEHSNTVEIAAVAATCTASGYTAGVQCSDCNALISGHEVVEALGHSWGEWNVTVAAGCETAGEQTHTCSACQTTQTQTLAALGHTVGEGTVTSAATCTSDGVMSYVCTACGNAATEAIPATGHTYVNGACETCGEAEPEVFNRFYIAAIRSSGNYYYMTSDLGTANTSRYQAVDSGLTTLPETITAPEADKVFVLMDNGDGTYSIYAEGVEGDNYLGWTSGNSGTLVAADSAIKATVDITDGVYNIHFAASGEERYLSLNGTSGNNYFAWYKSGQKQDLVLIPVVEGETTEPETTEPEATETETTEPEVTAPETTEPETTETETSEPETSEPVAEGYILTDIGSITAGQKVVITMTNANGIYAMTNANGTSKAPATVAVTVEDNRITSDVTDSILWNIEYSNGNLVIYPDGDTAKWLYCNSTNNGVRVGSNSDNIFTIDDTSGYLVHSGTGRYIGIYNSQDWRCYTSINDNIKNQTLAFYALIGDASVPDTSEPEVTEPEVTEPEATEPASSEPEVTEPETSEPEVTEPTGATTQLQYVFSDYTAGTQYAEGENHTLDEVITLTINGAHLNGQIRLYNGSNAVFTSTKEIDSIIIKAGNKAGTLNVYSSVDGSTWELVSAQTTTTSYTNYSFDMPAGCKFVKLESIGAQIRVSEMTVNVLEPALVAGMDMLLSDDLKVNFYLNAQLDVTVSVGGTQKLYTADELSETEDGKFVATVSVAAAQMTEEITVQADGYNAQTYTVRQYADKILADEAYSDYHAIVKEMLNYGGYAQQYFGYNPETLANADITGVGAAEVPQTTQDVSYTGAAEGITFYAASLSYRDKVALRFYFQVDGSIDGYTFSANGMTYSPVQKDTYYVVEVPNITPENLDQQVELTVTDAQGSVLTVSYGPMNYIVRMNQKGSDSLKALLKALYNYHLAAKALRG